ncbi:helix-turn-helix transcriptional regulator [Mycobacterium sp. Dal123C01]|uniref:helix-turn-helix transcriptional regulator n=1 Tax=Mycobacterium sp. Dal123C01 TaxID=3457577 RepID=UPI00403E4B82
MLCTVATIAPSNRRSSRRHPDGDAPASRRRWATTKQVSAYLGVTVRTIRVMAEDGRLTRYYLGPRIMRFDLGEIDAAFTAKAAQK